MGYDLVMVKYIVISTWITWIWLLIVRIIIIVENMDAKHGYDQA